MLLGGGGIAGALEMLGAHPDDWLIRCAITQRASDIDSERRKAEIEALAVLTGNRVGEIVVKALSKMF